MPLVGAFVLLALFPLFGGKFYVDLAMTIMILAVFAMWLELLVGATGLVSFGHAAFFGVAAYATALLSPKADAASLAWLLPAAVARRGALRRRGGRAFAAHQGIYFIMVTLAFAQMAYYVFHDTKLGGGSDGIYLYVKPVLSIGGATLLDLDKPMVFYYFMLGCADRHLRVSGIPAALALRPCARRHQGERAADARSRLLHLSLQARCVHRRRRAGRHRRISVRGEGRLRQSRRSCRGTNPARCC